MKVRVVWTPVNPFEALDGEGDLPERIGYDFAGYFAKINGEGEQWYNSDATVNIAILSDTWSVLFPGENVITLHAHWTLKAQYAITYNANGGTGTMSPGSVAQGDSYTIAANRFSRVNHSFTGWNTAANGGGTAYAAGAPITNVQSNITLYAQWTALGDQSVTILQTDSVAEMQTKVQTTIAATGGSGTVTVSGGKDNATTTLSLQILDGVTVRWEAQYSGSINPGNSMIELLDGAGAFEIVSGNITNDGNASAITVRDGIDVTVSGGTVSADGNSPTINMAGNGGSLAATDNIDTENLVQTVP